MTDVRLFHKSDGGDVVFVDGAPELSDDLVNAGYLSLFGGNEDDGGLEATDHLQWWGNLTETETARKYRSRTQHMLRSLPLIPANLRRLEDAAMQDLSWMTAELVTGVSVAATIPALNTVKLVVTFQIGQGKYRLEFLYTTGATK